MALCLAGPAERSRESIKARHGEPRDLGPLFGGTDHAGEGDRFTESLPMNTADDEPNHWINRNEKVAS
jgi:hypothetical protein